MEGLVDLLGEFGLSSEGNEKLLEGSKKTANMVSLCFKQDQLKDCGAILLAVS